MKYKAVPLPKLRQPATRRPRYGLIAAILALLASLAFCAARSMRADGMYFYYAPLISPRYRAEPIVGGTGVITGTVVAP